MKHKMNAKALYAAMAVSAGVAMAPASAQAAAYYYSLFELTNINLFGEYKKDVNGDGVYTAGTDALLWVRPGSNETNPRSASFVANTSATNSAGGSMAKTDSAYFNSHVPPSSGPNALPVDPLQSYTVAGAAENAYAQSGIAGQFSRADSIIENIGAMLTPFGVLQSAGENSKMVAEGRSTSPTGFASTANNTFTGYLDMADLDFDGVPVDITGDGIPDIGFYDGTNLGWTGRLMLTFNYKYDLQLSTDGFDPAATASRDVSFNIFREPGTLNNTLPHFLVGQMKGGFGDMNCDLDGNGIYGEDCGTELATSLSTSLGADYTEQSAANAGFMQIFDLTAQKNLGRFYYDLSFSQSVTGSAESIPEPGVLALLGLGVLGLGVARRARRAA